MLLINQVRTVNRRITNAAVKAGRGLEQIRLIAVTKTVDVEMITKAVETGLREFGESRIQEARDKILEVKSLLPDLRIIWHLIGHLQKNKTKAAVELFDIIHSVDSLELAEELNKHAEKIGKTQRILIQVKLADEGSKHGILNENVIELIADIAKMKNLKIQGLMTIPPYFEDTEMVRPYFRTLREIRDETERAGFRIPELSMGMSNDFEVAIEEGATMVRVGTAIFGEREREAK
jgi:PLP dependent protein